MVIPFEVMGTEMIFRRRLNAPVELVYRMWTEAEHIGVWWTPYGFTSKVRRLEACKGGRLAIDLKSPEGDVYPCRGFYLDLEKPGSVVLQGDETIENPCGAGLPPHTVLHISLLDSDHQTDLRMQVRFPSGTAMEAAREHGFVQGWESVLKTMEEILVQRSQI